MAGRFAKGCGSMTRHILEGVLTMGLFVVVITGLAVVMQ